MTREEAIEQLKGVRRCYIYITPNPNLEAIDMAIEALKVSGIPTGSGLISRQDVVSEIDEWIQMSTGNGTDMVIKDFLSFLKERIDTLPSAGRPTGEWIFERLESPLSDSFKDCYKCSNCGTHWEYDFRYCPNCGSKNGGRADD